MNNKDATISGKYFGIWRLLEGREDCTIIYTTTSVYISLNYFSIEQL